MEFRNSTEYQIIKNEFEVLGILNARAKFECFTDSTFVYGIKCKLFKHEISIIFKDMDCDLLNNELLSELIEMDNITYFSIDKWDVVSNNYTSGVRYSNHVEDEDSI